MEDQENRFMDKHRSGARELRRQVLDDIINDDKISTDDKLRYIKDYQKDDTDETVQLLEARSSSDRAQGNKALKIGAGVGIGTAGTGLLIWILNSIFGGNDKSA